MSKKLKPLEEDKIEEPIIETPVEPVIEPESIIEEMPKVYIPDIPAQMVEPKKEDNSVPEEPKGETEIEFLQKILFIQEDGGFGMHLHKLINNRIKALQ